LIIGIGWPLLSIFISLRTGSELQESLLVTLRERYPDLTFEKTNLGKGHEPGIPTVGIKVSSQPVLQVRKEILSFVETEIGKRKSRAVLIFDFIDENKEFILKKTKEKVFEWTEVKR
jgi:hypothetical protein